MKAIAPKDLPLIVGVLTDVRTDFDAWRERLTSATRIEGRLADWFRIKITTTRTQHVLRVIPTQRLRRYLAAVATCQGGIKNVQWTAFPQGVKGIARINQTEHFSKVHMARISGVKRKGKR